MSFSLTITATPDTERQLVGVLRDQKRVIAQAEITRLRTVVEWSLAHQTPPDVDPRDVGFGARYLALAGPGAPLVDEFAVTDLAATLGMSDHAGRDLVGHALELRYRLPRLWARVLAGRVATWRATRIASQATSLPAEAAAHIDEQLSHLVGGLGAPAVDRLVAETKVRFDPIAAAKQADGRYFQLGHRERDFDPESIHGQIRVHGLLDAADALDLEKSVARVASQLSELGSEESLDVRRSMAVGEIARAQLALDLDPDSGRSVELVVHVSADSPIARLENTRSPAIIDAVRAAPGARPPPRSPSDPRSTSTRPSTSPSTRSPTGSDARSPGGTSTASTRSASERHRAATSTTSSPTTPAGRRRPTTSPRSADDTIAPRPTAASSTASSAPAASSGPCPRCYTVRRDHEGTHPPVPPDE